MSILAGLEAAGLKGSNTAKNGGYTGMGDGSALNDLSSLAKRQNEIYQDNYVGFENALIDQALSPINLSRLRSALGDQRTMLEGIGQRANERLGIALSPEQAEAFARKQAFQNLAGQAAALTSGAQSQLDTNQSLLGQMGNFGRGLSGQATTALQTAAQMEQSREDQYAQAMDAYRNQKAQYNSSIFTGFGSW